MYVLVSKLELMSSSRVSAGNACPTDARADDSLWYALKPTNARSEAGSINVPMSGCVVLRGNWCAPYLGSWSPPSPPDRCSCTSSKRQCSRRWPDTGSKHTRRFQLELQFISGLIQLIMVTFRSSFFKYQLNTVAKCIAPSRVAGTLEIILVVGTHSVHAWAGVAFVNFNCN